MIHKAMNIFFLGSFFELKITLIIRFLRSLRSFRFIDKKKEVTFNIKDFYEITQCIYLRYINAV